MPPAKLLSKGEMLGVAAEIARVNAGGDKFNDTGIIPVEYKCVVRVVEVEEVTAGGIIKPQVRRERDQMAMTTATLLEAGGNAFEDWKGRTPKPGDSVLIQKYAGQFKEADPTDPVRVVNDKEILAVLEPGA